MITEPNIPTVEAEGEQRQRELAHRLWEEEGRPEGKADEHWSKAGLMILDLDYEAPDGPVPAWLRTNGMEPMTKEVPALTDIEELRERVKRRVG